MLIEILNHFRLTGRLVLDKRVNKWLKIFLVFIPLAYVFLIFPPDDFIPVIGLLDDLLLLAVTTILFITMCPEDVVREHRLILTGSLPQTKPINLEDYRCETENRDLALGFVTLIHEVVKSDEPPTGIDILPEVVTVPLLLFPDAVDVISVHVPALSYATLISETPFCVINGVKSLAGSQSIPTCA